MPSNSIINADGVALPTTRHRCHLRCCRHIAVVPPPPFFNWSAVHVHCIHCPLSSSSAFRGWSDHRMAVSSRGRSSSSGRSGRSSSSRSSNGGSSESHHGLLAIQVAILRPANRPMDSQSVSGAASAFPAARNIHTIQTAQTERTTQQLMILLLPTALSRAARLPIGRRQGWRCSGRAGRPAGRPADPPQRANEVEELR